MDLQSIYLVAAYPVEPGGGVVGAWWGGGGGGWGIPVQTLPAVLVVTTKKVLRTLLVKWFWPVLVGIIVGS